MSSLDRACWRAILGGLAVAIAASIAVGSVISPRAGALFAAFSSLSWCWVAVALGRARGAAGTFALGVATHLTLLRGLLVSLVAGFTLLGAGHRGVVLWLPGLLYAAAVMTDRYDGVVARRLGQVTDLGARLDVAMDGLGLLVAPVVAVVWGRLPPWYLLIGAAYYLFHGGIALRHRWGLAVYPDRLRPSRVTRFFAGGQMGLVAVALLPLLSVRINVLAATVLMVPTLGLFLRDWLVVVGRISAVTLSKPWPVDPVPGPVDRAARERGARAGSPAR